ncbi:MAG: MSHA biogenesis protein MshK [Burkholderiales bacterium]
MNRALFLLLLGASGLAFAQKGTLVDPTRPPIAAGESAVAESAAPAGPRLQSVLISPTRRVAVISGSTVVQGGKYGNATVAAITEGSVMLRYADRKETLHLISGVVKRERHTDDGAHSDKGNGR